jgi:hypothetical protein
MGLINLRTNLKDLKFGNDEPGGGNSKQPFIQTKIPATNEPLQTGISNAGPALAGLGAGAAIGAIGGSILGSTGGGVIAGAAVGLGIGLAYSNLSGDSLRLPSAGTGGPDFLIRGGTLLPGIITNDAIRLTKFFASTEGLLFTVKQNLLSRIAVKTQTSPKLLNDGVYTPLSALSQAVGSAFGLHVNKQGLNPFASTGIDSDNERLYGVRVTQEQTPINNRLINLYGAKFLINSNERNPDSRFLNNDVSSDPFTLLSYQGGPGSFLGIGNTRIKLASNPVIRMYPNKDVYSNINYLTLGYKNLSTYGVKTISIAAPDNRILGLADNEFNRRAAAGERGILDNALFDLGGFDVGSTDTSTDELENLRGIKDYVPTEIQKDFRDVLRNFINSSIENPSTILMSKAPSYAPGDGLTLEQRVNLGDPGNKSGKNLWSYTDGALGGAASQNSYDKINASVLYKSEGPQGTNNPNPDTVNNDLVKFRIGVIDNNNPRLKTYIHFRAFLDQISDNYSSNWDATKYIGRGENFYTYSGFDRKVSLGWTVAAQSKIELIPMYKKLNYLASVCAPDYSTNGYMRGNIVTLTIGGYFYEQPGIITGLNYEMNSENESWEIGINDEGNSDPSVKELPHLIRVTGFNFIPIHTFVPRLQQNSGFTTWDGDLLNDTLTYGKERFIALTAGQGSNYE